MENKKEPKQVIVMRTDLNMRKGKMISQGCHASLGVILDCMEKGEYFKYKPISTELDHTTEYSLKFDNDSDIGKWLQGTFTKITLGCGSEEELDDLYNKAEEAGLLCKMVVDKGLTEFGGVPTKTCIAIGPGDPDEINKITGNLKLL